MKTDHKKKLFNSKLRILINVSILRRDIGVCFFLKRVLEDFNFDVLLSGPSNNVKNINLWKPDLFITQTLGQSTALRKEFPNLKIVIIDPEGFYENYDIKRGRRDGKLDTIFEDNKELINNFDLYLCWGKIVTKEIQNVLDKKNKEKIITVGNPKLDIANFILKRKVKKTKKSIGIIGRFPSINSVTGKTTIQNLPNIGNLSRVIIQCKDFVNNHFIIKEILKKTDYYVSIRPHPLEQIYGTEKYVSSQLSGFEGRLEVDKSLIFSEWAMKQDYIITPTTSSFIETYRLGVPLIVIDYIAGTFSYWKKFKMLRLWQENSFCPKSLAKLIEIIKSKKKLSFNNKEVDKQYRDYCDSGISKSPVFRIAKIIEDFFVKNPKLSRPFFRVPKFLIRVLNIFYNRLNAKKDKLYYESYFDEIVHKEPSYLKGMVNFFKERV